MYTFKQPSEPQLLQQKHLQTGIVTLVACAKDHNELRLLTTYQDVVTSALVDSNWLQALQACGEFRAQGSECVIKASLDGSHLIVIGVGELSKLKPDSIRLAFCEGARMALRKGFTKIQFLPPRTQIGKDEGYLELALEGLLLGQAPIGQGADKQGAYFQSITAIDADIGQCEPILIKANANLLVRRLVNANADEMTPAYLAHVGQQIASDLAHGVKDAKVTCKVLDDHEIKKEGLGLLQAVAQGAYHPPRLLILTYQPFCQHDDPILLVGKGISYDTGGLKLKPAESMLDMRSDMAGAAAVIAAFQAVVKLNLNVSLVAIVAAAENAIGPQSYKLGDVFTAYNSKTVQITNTDAEGRLVIADAMSYGIEHFKPCCVVDIATLTGAAAIALGHEAAAIISNEQSLQDQFMAASQATAERLWPMPNFEEYFNSLSCDVADMKNSGSRQGGCCIAASFIQQFTNQLPWVHLDIAPVAFLEKEHGILSKLATGFGARLLIEWLQHR